MLAKKVGKILGLIVAFILLLFILVIALGIYKFNFTNDDVVVTAPVADTPLSQGTDKDGTTSLNVTSTSKIANPASVNCSQVGGRLVIEKRGDGGEYGLCYFDDNRACEEWALLNGRCPLGGIKTTGFDTIDQKYCVWAGGQTIVEPNSVCIFKNGQKCPTKEFYNGTCSFMLE